VRTLVFYNGAPSIEEVFEHIDSVVVFRTLEELKPWMDEGDRVFKITVAIEEVEC